MTQEKNAVAEFLLWAVLGGLVGVAVMLLCDIIDGPACPQPPVAQEQQKPFARFPEHLVKPSPYSYLEDGWLGLDGYTSAYNIYVMPDDLTARIPARAHIYKTYDKDHPIKVSKDRDNNVSISYDLSDGVEITAQERHHTWYDNEKDYYPIVAVHTHQSPIVISKSETEVADVEN